MKVNMFLKPFKLCCVMLSLTSQSSYVLAQENSDSEQNQLENVQIIGSRLPSVDNNQVIVVDSFHQGSLDDVLNTSASIQVNPNSGAGAVNELYLRGADSNFTLVFFNGIPLNDGTNTRGGAADISSIASFLVDRIEVSTGSRSAVHGSQAMAGVVSFVSEVADLNAGQAEYKAAFSLNSESGYEFGASVDFANISFNAVKTRSPELYQGSALVSESMLIVAQPNLSAGGIRLTLWANDAQAGSFPDDSGGALFAVNSELERRHSENRAASLIYQLPQVFDNGYSNQLVVSVYTMQKDEVIDTPAIVGGVRDPSGFPIQFVNNSLKKQNLTVHFEQQHQNFEFVVGVDYTYNKGASTGNLDFGGFKLGTDFSQTRKTMGIFTELDLPIFKDFSWQIAGRYEQTKKGSSQGDNVNEFTPSSTLVWRAGVNHRFSLHWGKGFKLPSFFALGHPLIGNPDLLNEESETWQGDYRFSHDLGQFSLAIFDYELINLVDFEPGPPPTSVNRAEANSRGVETGFVSNESANFVNWRLSHTYLDATIDGSQTMLGRAKDQVSFLIQKRFPDNDLGISLSADYRSSVYGSSIPTDRVKLDNTFDLGIQLSWQINRHVKGQIGVDNLSNDRLEFTPGNIHQGRYIWTSIEITL